VFITQLLRIAYSDVFNIFYFVHVLYVFLPYFIFSRTFFIYEMNKLA